LRKIVDPQGKFLCRDDCDSIGAWERRVAGETGTGRLCGEEDAFYREHRFHVDVNCYGLPVTLLRRVGADFLAGRGRTAGSPAGGSPPSPAPAPADPPSTTGWVRR
jgi:hypothetical protein